MKGWKKLLASLAVVASLPISTKAQNLAGNSLEKNLEHIKNKSGDMVFSYPEIELINRINAKEQVLSFFNDKGLTEYKSSDIIRYAILGVSRQEVEKFQDTDKPNAVVLFPEDEKVVPGVLRAFYVTENRTMINKLRESYDIYFRIIGRKEQIDSTLTTVPNTELLLIAGHGNPYGLKLDESPQPTLEELEQAIEIFENPSKSLTTIVKTVKGFASDELTIADEKILTKYFRKLAPNAVIFLSSCQVGTPLTPFNFAETVRKASNYRRVIAAKESFRVTEIILDEKQLYPLSLKIILKDNGKDVTYRGKTFEEIVSENSPPEVGLTKTLKAPNFFLK